MYKKIKATKNNSIKKALILSSTAVLASCAAALGTEQLGFRDGLTVSASFGSLSSWGGDYFGNNGYWGRGGYSNYHLNRNKGISMDTNQRENYDIFARNARSVVDSMRNGLSMAGIGNDMRDSYASGGVSALPRVSKKVARAFTECKEFKELGEAINWSPNTGQGNEANVCKYLVNVLSAAREYQAKAVKCLLGVADVVKFDRVKDQKTLDKMKTVETKLAELSPIAMVDAAELGHIANDASLKDKALKMAEDAVGALMNCTVLGYGTDDHGSSSEASEWEYMSEEYFSNFRDDRVPGPLRSLFSVFQTLLHINAAVDRAFTQTIVNNCVRRLGQAVKGSLAALLTDPDITQGKVAANDALMMFFEGWKQTFSQYLNELNSTPLVVLAALMSRSMLSSVLGESMANSIKYNNTQFTNHVIKAFVNRGKINSCVTNWMRYADRQAVAEKAEPEKQIVDLTKVVASAVGLDAAKTVFGDIDRLCGDMLSSESIETYRSVFKLTDEQVDKLKEVASAYSSGDPKYRFVTNNGLSEFMVSLTYDNKFVSFIEKMFSMSPILSHRAIIKLLIDEYNTGYHGSVNAFDDKVFNTVDETAFAQAVAVEGSWLDSLFRKCFELRDKVSNIKNSKSSDKESKSASADTGSGKFTNVIVLNGDNTNNSTYSFSFNNKSVTVANLPRDMQWGSLVLCPKTSKSAGDKKTVNKDVTIPSAPVVNGTVTVDLSPYLSGMGNYELHVRNEVRDQASGAVKEYQFLVKSKFAFDNVHKVNAMLEGTTEHSSNAVLDWSTLKLYYNDDSSITYRIRTQNKNKYDGNLSIVYFEQNQPANMEKDKHGLQYVGDGYYEYTTESSQDGLKQFHVYRGEVQSENYDGKVEFSTKTTKPVDTNAASGLSAALSKQPNNRNGDKEVNTVDKNFVVVIPSRLLFDSAKSNGETFNVTYSVIDSEGNNVLRGTTSLRCKGIKSSGYRSRYAYTYEGVFSLPAGSNSAQKGYRIKLETGLSEFDLESNSTVSNSTESNKELDFYRARGYGYGSDYSDYDDDYDDMF